MDMKDVSRYQDLIMAAVTNIGLKLLAAIVFWVIGRWLISLVLGMIRKALERQKVDPTVLRYLSSVVSVTLNVFLVIGILGYFGVQTTTFAALVAGIALGRAQRLHQHLHQRAQPRHPAQVPVVTQPHVAPWRRWRTFQLLQAGV